MNDLHDNLQLLQQALSGQNLQACTEAAAAPILAEAVRRAPVLHGDVRNGLQIVSTSTDHSARSAIQVADSGPGGDAHEAIFLEYGTSRMAAHPFMRPALEAAKDQALAQFEKALLSQFKDLT